MKNTLQVLEANALGIGLVFCLLVILVDKKAFNRIGLYTNSNELSPENGVKLINALVEDVSKHVEYAGSATGTNTELASSLNAKENDSSQYFATVRISTNDKEGKEIEHTMSVNSNSVFSNDITDIDNALGFKYNDTSNTGRTGTNDTKRRNIPLRIDYFKVTPLNWAMIENGYDK